MKIKRQFLEIYLRSAAITAVGILCVAIIYFGFLVSYQEMRKACFSDDRRAVIISSDYIKFFDIEVTF